METIAVRVIIGIIVGAICGFSGIGLERYILQKRSLETYISKKENIIVLVALMAVGVAVMMRLQMVTEIVYAFILTIICVVISLIDYHHRIIPNIMLIVMLIAGLVFNVLGALGISVFPKVDILYPVLGLVAGFIIFLIPAFFGKAVGAGDIKLAACIGFCLGVDGLLYSIVLMGVGVLTYSMVQKNKTLRTMMYEMVPMGPFMTVSAIVIMVIR